MPGTGPTPTIGLANTPVIENLTLTSAAQEYSYTFPNKTRRFWLHPRALAKIKMAFVANGTTQKWFTLPYQSYFQEDELDLSGTTIFLQSDTPNIVIEILSWQRT